MNVHACCAAMASVHVLLVLLGIVISVGVVWMGALCVWFIGELAVRMIFDLL